MSDEPTVRRVAFDTARLALSRTHLETLAACRAAARNAARICADSLAVERVGVWVFSDDERYLDCWYLYLRSEASLAVVRPERLDTDVFTAYRDALATTRVLSADDARTHPATRALAPYLDKHGISSMLDAPIFREGRLFGVVCHEHVGPARRWTADEISFASSVADVIATVFEQSDRLRVEAALRDQSARLAELSHLDQLARLVRAVVHDFRNVWTVLDIAVDELRPTADAEAIAPVDDCLRLGTELLDALARFDRPPDGPDPTVGDIVEGMRRPLELLVRDRASLAVDVDAPSAYTPLRRLELEQILLNLVVNARDAMSDGQSGRITLRARKLGGFAHLEVEDDGAGMDPSTRARVFEPYFSTREDGRGLGLSTVRDILDGVGGNITVDSALGHGSTFRVLVPLVA